jgi:hypothetical protein
LVEGYRQGKINVLREKPVPVLLYSPQISHQLAWNWTWTSALRDQWIIAWAITWLLIGKLNLSPNEEQSLRPVTKVHNYSSHVFHVDKESVYNSWLWIRCYWKLTNCVWFSVICYVTLMVHYTQPHLSKHSELQLDALWGCIAGELSNHTQNMKILVLFHSHTTCDVEVFSYAGTVYHSDCNGNCYDCHLGHWELSAEGPIYHSLIHLCNHLPVPLLWSLQPGKQN